MSQHPLFTLFVAGGLTAALVASPTDAGAAGKPSQKTLPASGCESPYKHTRPTFKN